MLLRLLALPAALTLSVWLPAQDLEKKIDYTTRAVPLRQAFAEISQKAGVNLFAQESLEKEVVILRLKDVSVKDAMQKIADTIGAEWRKVPDGYEMDRSSEMTEQMKAAALDAKTELVQTSLEKQVKALKLNQPLTDADISLLVAKMVAMDKQRDDANWRSTQVLQRSMPDERAIYRVLEKMDPKVIAAIPQDRRTVFSNKPNKMQRLISADMSDDAELLKDEHNRLVAAYPHQESKDPNALPSMYFFDVATAKKIESEPDRFVLTVSKTMFSDGYQLSLLVFDRDGHPITSGRASLDVDDDHGVMAERARIAKASQAEADIALSPITKQLLDYLNKAQTGGGGAGSEPVSGDLRQALLHPEETDPLAFATSEAFLGVAESRNENMVFYADDATFLVGLFAGMTGGMKPSLVMQSLSSLGKQDMPVVHEDNGWLTIQPAERIATLESRLDRAALGEFLREDDENGFVTLASNAKLAASIQGTQLPLLAMYVPMLISPELQFRTADVTMLKLYASLDAGQLQALRDHSPLHVSDFRPDQLALLTSFAYWNADWDHIHPANPGNMTQAEVEAKQEITEGLPNGLSEDCSLSMTSTNTEIYFAKVATDRYTNIDPIDLNSLAWYIERSEHPESGGPSDWHPRVLSVQPGEETRITLYLRVPGNDQLDMQADLKEQHRLPGGPWTLETMPDELKQKIKSVRVPMSSPGGAPPPPPPPATR